MNQPPDQTMKTCPACAEPIRAAAKVCPRCRQWQTLWSIQNPTLLCVIGLFFFLAVLFCVSEALRRKFEPVIGFASYREQVAVTEFKMSLLQPDTNRWVHVVGLITNRTDIAWKDLQVECRFFDRDGVLIDSENSIQRIKILGHDEVAFRVDKKAVRPFSDYASCHALVRYADNVDRWP